MPPRRPPRPHSHPSERRGKRPAPKPEGRTPAPEDGSAPTRLQKVLAHAGVASRRDCEALILQGRVTVNGQVVRELGTRVDPQKDTVALDGQPVKLERHVYFAVSKPKGYVSTNSDPAGRPRVIDLLPEVPQRVYTVGRLDENSVGLMLLTNDGELANKLAHPKFGVEKVYRAVVAGAPTAETLQKMTEGVWLAEGKVRAKRVRPIGKRGDATVLEMVLAEGKNREVRRMLARLGHKVMSLVRVAVGPVALKGLKPGEWRPLTGHEVELLRKVAAGIPIAPARGVYARPARERKPSREGASGPRPSRPGAPPDRPAGRTRARTSDTERPGLPAIGPRPRTPRQLGPPPSQRKPAARNDQPAQGPAPAPSGPRGRRMIGLEPDSSQAPQGRRPRPARGKRPAGPPALRKPRRPRPPRAGDPEPS